MAKLRHIALAVDDPHACAERLQRVFGFDPVGICDNELANGVFLSDGTLSLAVLKFKTDQIGRGLDFRGWHHVGFQVDDMDDTRRRLDDEGIPCVMDHPEGDTSSSFEVKFMDPSGFLFDVSESPWAGSEPLLEEE